MTVPFIVLHGAADVVTDPAISEHLHRVAPATDKTLRLYPDMWHALMHALPHETDQVCRDVFSWLDARA
jgi:alpha-beta hydrolase superfamily lysophospholipase